MNLSNINIRKHSTFRPNFMYPDQTFHLSLSLRLQFISTNVDNKYVSRLHAYCNRNKSLSDKFVIYCKFLESFSLISTNGLMPLRNVDERAPF